MEKSQLLNDFNAFFSERTCHVSPEDYELFEYNKSLLIRLSEVENSSMAVYDINKGNYAFVRSKFDTLLNYSIGESLKKGPNYFMQFILHEDIRFMIDTVKKTFLYLDEVNAAELKHHKLIFEYRMSDAAGNFYRFLQQCVVIEQDKAGKPWMVLILNDLIPNRPDNFVLQRKLMHVPSGKICLFQDDYNPKSNKLLSKREIEILRLISQGFQSKEISERLFISVNTVNNHRQKIIEKINADNTYEALSYAKTIGII